VLPSTNPVAAEPLTLDPIAELIAIQNELQKRDWQEDPHRWFSEKLHDHLWSRQAEIARSVAVNRRTLVLSCHEVGKSFIAAGIAGWWLDVWPAGTAFVVTSAPSGPQVKAILWREIGRVHARGRLSGRVNQTEWWLPVPGGKDEIVAFGRKPDDYDPTAFQGIHAPRVLVIFDEANGIRGPLWEAADSLIANDDSKMLLIGNPDDPQGEFYEYSKPGSGNHVIQIGAFDSPNFTGEIVPLNVGKQLIGRTYVEEKRRKWARKWYWVDSSGSPTEPQNGVKVVQPDGTELAEVNPFWCSKILGIFPELNEEMNLIPIRWIKQAQERTLPPIGESELGVDVGAGGDASTGCHRHGQVARILWEDHNPDTMHTCGTAIMWRKQVGATRVKIDEIGIGKGVLNRAQELKEPFFGIDVGESANDPEHFANRRAEIYWEGRELFEHGEIDIDEDDEDLAAELSSIRYMRTSSGQIQIESKQHAKDRGVPSPNRAEALFFSFAKPRKKFTKVTWGR
jgi:hypothetical protein